MGTIARRLRTLFTRGGSARAIPWIVLVLGLVVSTVVFLQLQMAQQRDLQDDFRREGASFAATFQDTVARHQGATRSTSALFTASDEVTRDEFHAFGAQLDPGDRHPGLQGSAFVQPVSNATLDAYLDERRSEGDGNFMVHPPGNRSTYWVLTYQSRFPGLQEPELLPLGLDLRTRAPLAAVLADARDDGGPTATPVGADGLEDGTLAFARPLYANASDPGTTEARRDAHEGWVLGYASPSGILSATATTPVPVGVRLFEGPTADGPLLAETDPGLPVERARDAGFLQTETVDAFGQPWTLQFVPGSESVYLSPPPTPWVVLGGSLLVTVLLVGLVRSVSRSEVQARRRVEAATRDLRQAQQVANVGSWEWHVPPDDVSWSDEQYRLFGREPGDPPDPDFGTFLESVHPDDRDRVDELITSALEERSFPSFEYRVRGPDGTVRWVEARGSVEVEDGQVVRMRGTTLDITDRVLPLRRFESLVETSPDAIVQANDDGEIVGWNEGAEAIFGWEEEEVLGEPLTTIMPEEYRDAHREGFQRYLETGEAVVMGQTLELEGLRADGTTFPAELSLDSYEVGGARFFSGILRDVTDRREMEAELRRAMEEAEAADEAKSRFLATMSHEIRTPMNAILGLTEILRDSDLSEEQQRHLESVHASGEHLLTLIDDVLDFSKIEAGELALEDRAFDLRETVEEALEMIAPDAGGKGLELAYTYAEDVPEVVRGDPGRVRQVLVNLLSNAVKFTDEGEVVARVFVLGDGPGDGAEVHVAFEVEDTGIGLEADDVEDLFDPFVQADASPERRHEGTGLGLAISHRLVELMGGTLEAEGAPGEGSTFRLVVPFTPAERTAERSWKTRSASLEGAGLLVVDDSEISRDILGDLARRWGMDVTAVASPGEALDRLRDGLEVDLAVLDYAMPGMTGVELARRLRSDLGLGDLPLLMLTSMPEAEQEVRAADVDVVDVLVKPVEPSTLFDALQATIGERDDAGSGERGSGFDASLGERLDLEVLLVEDNPVNREVVQKMLTRLGFDPDIAEDGEAGLDRVHEGNYDVVFMDVQMPGMDGHEATRRIREALPESEQPRIVALTAHAGVEDRQRALEAGMDDYISKPVSGDELGEALERSARPPSEGDGEDLTG